MTVLSSGRGSVVKNRFLTGGVGGRALNIIVLMRLRAGIACCLPSVAALFSGCASYNARPLSAEKSAESLTARSLGDPGLRQFMERNGGAAGPQWTLHDLTMAAWYYHSDMAVARAQVAAAEAGVRVAKERPEPTIGFAPQFTANPGGLSPWTLGYSLDLPLETAGKRAKRTDVAMARASSARFQLAAAAWKVRSGVRSSMLSLWRARESARLVAQHADDQAALADLLERRYSAGEIGLAEVLPLRISAGRERVAVQDARKQEMLAEANLAQAVGVSGRALADCRIDFSAVMDSTPRDVSDEARLRRWALLGRPDILAALADYAAAEAALRLEIARQYPDLNLGPGYTWDQGADRWSLGISLTLPVFGRNRGAIARAEADRTSAKARFDALQAGILGELESARAGYLAGCEGEKAAEDVFARQRLQFSSADARFNAGESGRAEWLASRLLYDEAANTRLDASVRVQESIGALEDAVQRPL